MGLDPSAPAPKKKIPSIVGVRSDVATPAPILLRQSLEGRTRSLRGGAIWPARPAAKPENTNRPTNPAGPCKSTSPSKPLPSRTACGVIAASPAAAPAKPSEPTISVAPALTVPGEPTINAAPAVAVPAAIQHNDSTLRVTPLPAARVAVQPVRVLPTAPRSSRAPLIAIVCLLVAGLAIGVYFALPYVSDWYKSESAPLQIDDTRAPKSIAQQSAASSTAAAPRTTATTPKSKKAKGPKTAKKKVGAAKKPRKQR